MTALHPHSPSNHPPARARLDNSSCDMGDVSQEAFYSSHPLAETGPSDCTFMQRRWGRRAWFGTALNLAGETFVAAALTISPIIGIFAGDIFR